MPKPQRGGGAFVSFPMRGNGFIDGAQLTQVADLLTLAQSFLLR